MWEVFSVERKIPAEAFGCRTKFGSFTYIMCKRGEDNQDGTGTESFCREYQEASFGSSAEYERIYEIRLRVGTTGISLL